MTLTQLILTSSNDWIGSGYNRDFERICATDVIMNTIFSELRIRTSDSRFSRHLCSGTSGILVLSRRT